MFNLLRLISGYKLYILVGAIGLSAGSYVGYNLHKFFTDSAELKQVEKVYEAEEFALELKDKRKQVDARKYKEVKEYVEDSPTRPGLSDDELRLFNLR